MQLETVAVILDAELRTGFDVSQWNWHGETHAIDLSMHQQPLRNRGLSNHSKLATEPKPQMSAAQRVMQVEHDIVCATYFCDERRLQTHQRAKAATCFELNQSIDVW